MGEKRLKGKAIPKHETEADWLLSSYVPERGEIVIYDVDETHTHERQKIGDGISSVKDLPFSSIRPLIDVIKEDGKEREYLIAPGALLKSTTELSVTVPNGQGFMVRACKSATNYGWFNFIDSNGQPIEPPKYTEKHTIKIPVVTRTSTTASWEPVEGATYYEYLIGKVTKYHTNGSFADTYNSVYVEMNNNRGLYGGYSLSASAEAPRTPEPDRYVKGGRLDSIPIRLGNPGGEHPEYAGHIQVPKAITVPEGATQAVKDKINNFATSKYYVDQQDAAIRDDVNKLTSEMRVETNGEIPLIQQVEPGRIPFEFKKGLYAQVCPQNCQDYENFDLGTDQWIELGTTNDIAFTDSPASGAGLSLKNEDNGKAFSYQVASTPKGNNGKIFIGNHVAYEGKKFIFETDACITKINTTATEPIKWFFRFHLRDQSSLTSTAGRIWDSSASGGNITLSYSSKNGIYLNGATIPSKKIAIGEWFNLRFEQIKDELYIYINHELVCTKIVAKSIESGVSCIELQGRQVAYDSEILFDNTCMFMNDDDFFGGSIKPGGVAGRLPGGYINVPEVPVSDEHAASKKYVDDRTSVVYVHRVQIIGYRYEGDPVAAYDHHYSCNLNIEIVNNSEIEFTTIEQIAKEDFVILNGSAEFNDTGTTVDWIEPVESLSISESGITVYGYNNNTLMWGSMGFGKNEITVKELSKTYEGPASIHQYEELKKAIEDINLDYIEIGTFNSTTQKVLAVKSYSSDQVEVFDPTGLEVSSTMVVDEDWLPQYYEIELNKEIPNGTSVQIRLTGPGVVNDHYDFWTTKKTTYIYESSEVSLEDEHYVEIIDVKYSSFSYKYKITPTHFPSNWSSAKTLYYYTSTGESGQSPITKILDGSIYLTNTISAPDYIYTDKELANNQEGLILLNPTGILVGSHNQGYGKNIFNIGNNNEFANKSKIIGNNLKNTGTGLIVGQYNKTTDGIFVVGCGGTYGSRRDAIVVNSAGKVFINGSAPVLSEQLTELQDDINEALDAILAIQNELINGALEYELNASGTSYTVKGIGTYKSSDIVIPDTYKGIEVSKIAENAFKDNKNITSATIGRNIIYIGKEAFLGCDNLSTVYLLREAYSDDEADWDYSCHSQGCLIRYNLGYTTPEEIAHILTTAVACNDDIDDYPYTTNEWHSESAAN